MNRPSEFPVTMQVGRETSINTELGFPANGVGVDNNTSQWVYVNDANRFVAPNTSRQFSLGATRSGKATFQAPPGKSQAATVAGEECILVFTSEPLPTTGAQVPSVLTAAPVSAGCRVRNSANLTTLTGTNTVLTFDTNYYDTDSMHSTTVNTGRLTIRTAGKYVVSGCVVWDTGAGGTRRAVFIRLNGLNLLASGEAPPETTAALSGSMTVSCIVALVVGDFLELVALQDSGGALVVVQSADLSPTFSAQRISS